MSNRVIIMVNQWEISIQYLSNEKLVPDIRQIGWYVFHLKRAILARPNLRQWIGKVDRPIEALEANTLNIVCVGV